MQNNQDRHEVELSPGSIPRKLHRRSHGRSRFEGSGMQGAELKNELGWILCAVARARSCSWQNLFVLMVLVPSLYLVFVWCAVPMTLPGSRSDLFDQLHLSKLTKPSDQGLTYRSQEFFDRIWPAMEAGNITGEGKGLPTWEHLKRKGEWIPCFGTKSDSRGLADSTGYLIVGANGGLNQQRASICNAVAVARLLNATLVIPTFQVNAVWQDTSEFSDIYDEEHFITTLSEDVRVVKSLPEWLIDWIEGSLSNAENIKVNASASASVYLEKVLPQLLTYGVIQVNPFANRLSHDGLPDSIQRLRCRTNVEALRFAEPISRVGQTLVHRMRERSFLTGGNYVAVHLRFEKDIVAFSRCEYAGSPEEKEQMDEQREVGWKTKFSRARLRRADVLRKEGKCPLSPVEVGLELRGMGFGPDTPIYLAGGKIYKEDYFLTPLRKMFPNLVTKESLLSSDELQPFKNYSSRMAALDYTVCLESEVFVATHGGNFVSFLTGHRRFLNGGHSKTIKPDKRKMALLMDQSTLRWEEFAAEMIKIRRLNDLRGQQMRQPGWSLYTFPAPDCMCPKNSHQLSPRPRVRQL